MLNINNNSALRTHETPSTPSVSVCLLTWNRSKVLGRSIESLLSQTYADIELIVCDDNSSDATGTVANKFVQRDPRVRYIRNLRNLKYSGNSNAAVESARGKYVVFAHDGDIYHPTLIEKWHNAMEQNPTAGLAFCGLREIPEHGEDTKASVPDFPRFIPGRWLADYMVNRFDSPVFGITMVKKEVFSVVGHFDERLPRLTDIDMWIRILLQFDATYIPEPLIDIMPREVGHENRGVNWAIQKQLESIRLSNIYRLYSDAQVRDVAIAKFYVERRYAILRNVLWCIWHLKFARAVGGLSHWRQNILLLN